MHPDLKPGQSISIYFALGNRLLCRCIKDYGDKLLVSFQPSDGLKIRSQLIDKKDIKLIHKADRQIV
jgi:hypothetical protein